MAKGSVREKRPGRWELRRYIGRDPLTGKKRSRSMIVSADNEEDARRLLLQLSDEVASDDHGFDLLRATAVRRFKARLKAYRVHLGDQVIDSLVDDLLADFDEEVVRATHELDRTAARLAGGMGDDFDPRGYFVYILRGANGEVLYVGQSSNILARLGTHLGDTKKQPHVHRVSLIRCADARAMSAAERRLIRTHQPLWNVVGVDIPLASVDASRPGSRGRGPTTTDPGLTAPGATD